MEVVGGVGLHPAGEAFVEPEVVPPSHGDQVAEPLMRHFMGNHLKHQLAVTFGGTLGIKEKMLLRIEDRTPILHRSAADLSGCGDKIKFGKRKMDAEIGIVI